VTNPNDSQTYQYLEKLTSIATAESYLDAVREAKARYFRATGEVFEDDSFFEPRMNGFLEYYLFDWPAAPGGKSSTAVVIERGRASLPPDELVAYAGFDRNVHAIFEFKKKKGEIVTVLNLYDDEKYEVHERRTLAGLEKGDVFEARLLPFGDKLHFSNAFVFHPRAVRKFVISELKNARKAVGKPTAAIHRLAYLRLRFDRLRRVDVEKIYSKETIALIEREMGTLSNQGSG
jgi:hypothetical protein